MDVSERELRRRVTCRRVVECSINSQIAAYTGIKWLKNKWAKDYEAYQNAGGKVKFEFVSYVRRFHKFPDGAIIIGRGRHAE